MIAVIDIGSNSVRMLVQYPDLKFKLAKITRLSEGLSLTGFLKKTAISRTVQTVRKFCKQAIKLQAEHIYIFATEAVRSAANGDEFVYEVKTATGLGVDVLSGETEAKIGYMGALGSGLGGIIDIGGASTEVTIGEDNNILYTSSCPIGAVRLTDLFMQNEALMSEHIAEHAVYGNDFNCGTFKAIGGTAATLASMDLELAEFSGEAIEGHILTLEKIISLKNKIFSVPADKRNFAGLHPSRRTVISAGSLILIKVMELLHIGEVTVSDSDNLEGYLKYKYTQS